MSIILYNTNSSECVSSVQNEINIRLYNDKTYIQYYISK